MADPTDTVRRAEPQTKDSAFQGAPRTDYHVDRTSNVSAETTAASRRRVSAASDIAERRDPDAGPGRLHHRDPAPVDGAGGSWTEPAPEVLDAIRERRGWFVALGVALVVAGLAAVAFPFLASIAAKVMIGWLLLIAGGVTLFHAFQTRSWSSSLWNAAMGLLSLAAGVYLAFFPLAGLIGLTLVLGAVFATQGAIEAGMAWQNRPRKGWGWMLASGIMSILLGAILLFGLPGTAVWALGLLVGIHFLTSGAALLALTGRA